MGMGKELVLTYIMLWTWPACPMVSTSIKPVSVAVAAGNCFGEA